jgi:hypothetical protein
MLLVGPGGEAVMLMSDAGGTDGVNGTITFDDDGPPLPATSEIPPGTYAPTDYQDLFDDFLPSPAPPEPYGTSLSVFKGRNPNGSWKLFILDDQMIDEGEVTDGWSLNVHSAGYICCDAPPRLEITLAGANVLIAWPVSATGYTLMSKANLNPALPWSPVGVPAVISNGLNHVSLGATGRTMFFRLQK